MNDLEYAKEILVDFIHESNKWDNIDQLLKDKIIQISNVVFKKIGFADDIKEIEFSVVLADKKLVRELNKKYRGIDKTTNVLSIPTYDLVPYQYNDIENYHQKFPLGDIILCFDTLTKESKQDNRSFNDHFFHLFCHGLLHLLGFDHQEDHEAEIMEQLEKDVLRICGIKFYES